MTRSTVRFGLSASIAVLTIAAAACGDAASTLPIDVPAPSGTSQPVVTAAVPATTLPSVTSTPVPTTPPPATTAVPATTVPTTAATTTTAPTPTTTTLPGDSIDWLPWQHGDVLAVVGVAHDDVLNVRATPGGQIVTTLPPTGRGAVYTGNAWQLPQSAWAELDLDGTVGWSSIAYLGGMGGTTDATSFVVSQLGAIPTAETMADLGLLVVGVFASDDPPSSIVLTVAPSVGDLGEVTYDVVGFGDDSVMGGRYHVFGAPIDSGGFSLKTVEVTSFCYRGVSQEGLCI